MRQVAGPGPGPVQEGCFYVYAAVCKALADVVQTWCSDSVAELTFHLIIMTVITN